MDDPSKTPRRLPRKKFLIALLLLIFILGAAGVVLAWRTDLLDQWLPSNIKEFFGRKEQPVPTLTVEGVEVRMLVARSGNIWISELDGSNSKKLTNKGSFQEPAFSPAGDKITFFDKDGYLWIMDLGDGSKKKVSNKMVFEALWSPDGSKILISTKGPFKSEIAPTGFRPLGGLYIVYPEGNFKEVKLLSSGGGSIKFLWSGDGKSIAYSKQDEVGVFNENLEKNVVHRFQFVNTHSSWTFLPVPQWTSDYETFYFSLPKSNEFMRPGKFNLWKASFGKKAVLVKEFPATEVYSFLKNSPKTLTTKCILGSDSRKAEKCSTYISPLDKEESKLVLAVGADHYLPCSTPPPNVEYMPIGEVAGSSYIIVDPINSIESWCTPYWELEGPHNAYLYNIETNVLETLPLPLYYSKTDPVRYFYIDVLRKLYIAEVIRLDSETGKWSRDYFLVSEDFGNVAFFFTTEYFEGERPSFFFYEEGKAPALDSNNLGQ